MTIDVKALYFYLSRMISIAIYDDSKERRQALKLLIELQDNMICVGDYADCNSIASDLKSALPDVVLMDINMPGMSGTEAVKIIHKSFPQTLIIMQTVFDNDDKIFNSIINGAHGYFLKKTAPEKLIEGIYDVVNGGAPMTATVAKRVLELFRHQSSAPTEKFDLSEREIEILSYMVKGYSHKMIGARFTVKNHIKNVYQKLHVHNATEAVSTALNKKIINPNLKVNDDNNA